ERLAIVPAAAAHLAGDVHVGQEVHLDRDDAVAGARLAAAALHVEREASGAEATRPRVGQLREQLPDWAEESGIGGGIGPRAAADGRLADLDDLVDELPAHELVVCAWLLAPAAEPADHAAVERVDHQGALPRARHAGDAGHRAGGNRDVDAAQVVGASAAHPDAPAGAAAPVRRDRDDEVSRQVATGQRGGIGDDLGR